MQAAVGVAQLEKAEEIIEKKINVGKMYRNALESIPGISLVEENPDSINTYWLFSLVVDKEMGWDKKIIQQKLLDNGIETRNLFYPLHKMPPYTKYLSQGDIFPVSEYLSENGFSLPSSVHINDFNVNEIAGIISEIYEMNNIIHSATKHF